MIKQLIKLFDRATKDGKSITITTIIIISLSWVIYFGYYFLNIPTNARIVTPADTYNLSNEISVTDTNIHAVGVYVIFPENRWDLIDFMWEAKKFINHYSAIPLEDTAKAHPVVLAVEHEKSSLEAEIEKYSTLETYFMNTYGLEKMEALFDKFLYPEETLGNSDTLAITLLLKQIAEDEVIDSSNYDVAITGNMDAEGNVLTVGEILMKTITADRAKADYFIVPQEQYEVALAAKEKWNLKIDIKPVQTVDEAYDFLQEIQ